MALHGSPPTRRRLRRSRSTSPRKSPFMRPRLRLRVLNRGTRPGTGSRRNRRPRRLRHGNPKISRVGSRRPQTVNGCPRARPAATGRAWMAPQDPPPSRPADGGAPAITTPTKSGTRRLSEQRRCHSSSRRAAAPGHATPPITATSVFRALPAATRHRRSCRRRPRPHHLPRRLPHRRDRRRHRPPRLLRHRDWRHRRRPNRRPGIAAATPRPRSRARQPAVSPLPTCWHGCRCSPPTVAAVAAVTDDTASSLANRLPSL